VSYGYPDSSATPGETHDTVTGTTTLFDQLAGGTQLTSTNNVNTWSYPDLHGDNVVTANQAGTQTGTTTSYDPFGNVVHPNEQTGTYTYGYEGKHDIGTDNTTPITLIEMGERVYTPQLGRFLQVDPIPGGSANNYDYGYEDPVSNLDLLGQESVEEFDETGGAIPGAASPSGGSSETSRPGFNPDQQTVIRIAKESRGGISLEDGQTLSEWAEEHEVPNSHGPDVHPSRPGFGSHPYIKINGLHIRIR
jgi:RHS repeat-associated protein